MNFPSEKQKFKTPTQQTTPTPAPAVPAAPTIKTQTSTTLTSPYQPPYDPDGLDQPKFPQDYVETDSEVEVEVTTKTQQITLPPEIHQTQHTVEKDFSGALPTIEGISVVTSPKSVGYFDFLFVTS